MFDISSRLMRNPLVLAMILGMTCAEYGWSMSSPVARTVDLLSSASAPTALFYIGCSLAAIPVKKFSRDLLAVSLSKLLIHPAAVLIVFYLLPADGDQTLKAAFVNAAMPMATVYPLLGQRYGQEGICSATLVFTTALSFLTLSGTSWLISSGVW
jgi:predicted permease